MAAEIWHNTCTDKFPTQPATGLDFSPLEMKVQLQHKGSASYIVQPMQEEALMEKASVVSVCVLLLIPVTSSKLAFSPLDQ